MYITQAFSIKDPNSHTKHKVKKQLKKRLRKKLSCDVVDGFDNDADKIIKQANAQKRQMEQVIQTDKDETKRQKKEGEDIKTNEQDVEKIKESTDKLEKIKNKINEMNENTNSVEDGDKSYQKLKESTNKAKKLEEKLKEQQTTAIPAIDDLENQVAKQLEDSQVISTMEEQIKLYTEIAVKVPDLDEQVKVLQSKLTECKEHTNQIASLNKKIDDCEKHDVDLQLMQKYVDDLDELPKKMQPMDEDIIKAQKQLENKIVKETRSDQNVMFTASVIGVYDQKGGKRSTSIEQFQAYFQNTLTPSSDMNNKAVFNQINNQDGLQCIGTKREAEAMSMLMIDMHYLYDIKECIYFIETNKIDYLQFWIWGGEKFEDSYLVKSVGGTWTEMPGATFSNNMHNKDPTKLLATKVIEVNQKARFWLIKFKSAIDVQAIGGIKCYTS